MPANPQLIVALDVDSRDQALRLRESLDGVVDFYKVGLELFTAAGPEVLKELAGDRVFLDLKFHDIPNTVAGAVSTAAGLGVDIVDVHASAGRRALDAAMTAKRASERPLVFGVTVLTHLADDELAELGVVDASGAQVVRLARLAAEAGLDGVVASPLEIEAVRAASEDRLKLLVPGIRPEWASANHDQRRVATPASAVRAGASYLVVGRAITESSSPRDAARRVADEMAAAAAAL